MKLSRCNTRRARSALPIDVAAVANSILAISGWGRALELGRSGATIIDHEVGGGGGARYGTASATAPLILRGERAPPLTFLSLISRARGGQRAWQRADRPARADGAAVRLWADVADFCSFYKIADRGDAGARAVGATDADDDDDRCCWRRRRCEVRAASATAPLILRGERAKNVAWQQPRKLIRSVAERTNNSPRANMIFLIFPRATPKSSSRPMNA